MILLGGRTGRDGIGGATGSSKSHNRQSLTTMASEVQKGNAPEERKIQRLFRDGNVTRLIKRCNDFGAGGVSVAVGELADGLDIDLDAVRKKYDGLDGTELAISESQERMAVVVARSRRRPIHRRRGGGESGGVPRGGGDGVPPDGDALAGQDHRGPEPGLPEHQRRGEARPGGGSCRPFPRPRSPRMPNNSSLRAMASSLASASRRGPGGAVRFHHRLLAAC